MKFLALPVFLVAASITAQAAKPNVIFVLVDDMGWGDLGVFYQNGRGSSPKFVTPNLDTIAAEGIQLRRHYCPAPVCAPSRTSLLLGVHQGHANVRDNQFDKELENNHTLGTVMRQAGYATAAIGKWGLQGSGLPAPGRPQLRGFDYFFGYLEHGDAHYHYPKETGANVYDGTTDIVANLDKCYSTDLIAARTKKWIVDQHTANPTQPFQPSSTPSGQWTESSATPGKAACASRRSSAGPATSRRAALPPLPRNSTTGCRRWLTPPACPRPPAPTASR
jgi:arylsulfatase A-like enzyme